MTNLKINQLFSQLDDWRHLPSYQLERRADIFFSLYLPEVLQKKFKLLEAPILIPEFPCRIGTVFDSKSNQSFKIDYLAITKDGENVFFVELKTDIYSRNKKQDENMLQAEKKEISELFSGIKDLHKASIQKQKYLSLYRYLSEQLKLEINLDGIISKDTFAKFKVKPKIVYLQPAKSKNEYDIDFEYFANEILSTADPLSQRFADSLRNWQTKAGSKQ